MIMQNSLLTKGGNNETVYKIKNKKIYFFNIKYILYPHKFTISSRF